MYFKPSTTFLKAGSCLTHLLLLVIDALTLLNSIPLAISSDDALAFARHLILQNCSADYTDCCVVLQSLQ